MTHNTTYSGKMTATLSSGSTLTLKNRGTKELGRVITKALAGYDIGDEIPRYFNIESYNNEGETLQTLLNRNLPFTGVTYTDEITETERDIIGQLDLNCIIMSQHKVTTNISDKVRFCMYNSKNVKLAEVSTNLNNSDTLTGNYKDGEEISSDTTDALCRVYNEIVDGTDCLIHWTMTFMNDINTGGNT